MPRLRRLRSREIVGILEGFGFRLATSRGSHAKLVRMLASGQRQVLTIPLHSQLAIGTVRANYRQASRFISPNDLRTKFFSD